jgi:hypothetical protein
MCGDIRACHDISGGSHLHALMIFRSAIAKTGARQYEGEVNVCESKCFSRLRFS